MTETSIFIQKEYWWGKKLIFIFLTDWYCYSWEIKMCAVFWNTAVIIEKLGNLYFPIICGELLRLYVNLILIHFLMILYGVFLWLFQLLTAYWIPTPSLTVWSWDVQSYPLLVLFFQFVYLFAWAIIILENVVYTVQTHDIQFSKVNQKFFMYIKYM